MKRKLPARTAALSLACAVAISLIPVTGTTASAAEPGAVPSQITLSLGSSETSGTVSVNLNWVTDTDVTSSEVIYGQDPALSDGVHAAASMTSVDSTNFEPEGYRDHVKAVHTFQAEISGLTPGATYYYQTGNAQDGYSETRSFRAPEASEEKDPFSFLFSADTQGRDAEDYQNTKDLYDYLAENESDADFLIHTGDIVEDASYSDYWQCFFDAADGLLTTMPIMATPGNHDANKYDPNMVQYRARFNYENLTAPEGLSEAAQGTVYSFEYGDALFICLNSYLSEADDDLQWQFLADQCANTDRAWTIVYYHQATYDPGASHYQLDNQTGKKLTDAGVDLVLNGHEHAYARSTIRTVSTADGTGSIESADFGEAPTYVIGGSVYNYAYSLSSEDTSWSDYFYDLRIDKTGTGGGAIYSPGVYSRVDVSSNALTFTAYYKATGSENDFRVIDTFTLEKSGDEITQPVGGGTEPSGVTYLWDSDGQQAGEYVARFNWVTDTDITGTQLFYATKADYESNGGHFTNFVEGDETVVDLSDRIAAMQYTGGTANYEGEEGAEYCYAPVMSHKAETATLQPGTEYVYCVGDGSANTTSVTEPLTFTTPAADTDTFDFLFFTDAQQGACGSYEATREAYNDFHDMLTRAVTDYPDAAFLLSGGDNVNYGIDTWEWDAFYDAAKDVFEKYPFYLTVGNHECDGAGNSWAPNASWDPVDQTNSAVLGRCNVPQNGAAYYGGGDGTQRMTSGVAKLEAQAGNYYFIYGDTLFLVMDYQDSTLDELTEAEQEWIQSVVKQHPTRWRVAVMHKTLFGYRVSDPTTGTPRTWTDVFDEAGIDLVLMGHDHVYARTKYYSDGAATDPQTPGSGTTYITGASANTDNRSDRYVEKPYTLIHSTTDYGRAYVAIHVSPDEIRVTTKGIENDQLVTLEDNALVTNQPRTYDLSDFQYPAVPEETDDLSVTAVEITGYPKEGQTLKAEQTPASATVTYQWERSADQTAWTAIDGATENTYQLTADDVGSYIRCTVTGTDFYHGTVSSEPTAKVTSLSGTVTTVEIGTADEFVSFVNGFGTDAYPVDGNYVLTAPIDLTGTTLAPIGGSDAVPFIGTFNGGGNTITGLTIQSDADSVGLFAYVGPNGRVANVTLADVSITAPECGSCGGIAGSCAGTIENCAVSGTITGNKYTAGIVGRLHGGTLQNCLTEASVTCTTGGGLIGGTNYGGPITAKNTKDSTVIQNNLVLGTVSGQEYTGAFAGDVGGSKGCILGTVTGNAVNNSVTSETPNCIAGYWSGSRPIVGADPVNYYVTGLTKDGISSSNTSAQNAWTEKQASDFGTQATYETLGWDFGSTWTWDAQAGHPVPAVIPVETGDQMVTIIASAGKGGSISPEGYVLVESGASQTFTFTPNEYFEIDSVSIDGTDNPQAAQDGSYTFENVTELHRIDVTYKLSDTASGTAPSVLSESAYYNRSAQQHINIMVSFGEGALGITDDVRHCVESAVILKDGQQVFDCHGCYWFPSHGQEGEPPQNMFQICYDDMEQRAAYSNLVPGNYEIQITFKDINSTVCTIPLTVTDIPVHELTVSGGTFTAIHADDNTSAKIEEGAQVTVTPTVPDGQAFDCWTAEGLADADLSQRTLTFTMPAGDVTLEAHFRDYESVFTDVPENAYYYGDVYWALDAGITAGTDAQHFSPQDSCTRAQFVSFLYRAAGSPVVDGTVAFTDVRSDAYYYDAVVWATQNGIAYGTSQSTFSPDEPCTRAQTVTFLWRYAGSPDTEATVSFTDVGADAYYFEPVAWAVDQGITYGETETQFGPGHDCTRAQTVAFLHRMAKSV